MKRPFRKNLKDIPLEHAHGGSGSRQLILSKLDPISNHLEVMTKGYLVKGGIFDWHSHKDIDEFWIVLKGTGKITYEDETVFEYKPGDIIYNPANISHKIENSELEDAEYYFIRIEH